jgi:hypothetical protein
LLKINRKLDILAAADLVDQLLDLRRVKQFVVTQMVGKLFEFFDAFDLLGWKELLGGLPE